MAIQTPTAAVAACDDEDQVLCPSTGLTWTVEVENLACEGSSIFACEGDPTLNYIYFSADPDGLSGVGATAHATPATLALGTNNVTVTVTIPCDPAIELHFNFTIIAYDCDCEACQAFDEPYECHNCQRKTSWPYHCGRYGIINPECGQATCNVTVYSDCLEAFPNIPGEPCCEDFWVTGPFEISCQDDPNHPSWEYPPTGGCICCVVQWKPNHFEIVWCKDEPLPDHTQWFTECDD